MLLGGFRRNGDDRLDVARPLKLERRAKMKLPKLAKTMLGAKPNTPSKTKFTAKIHQDEVHQDEIRSLFLG